MSTLLSKLNHQLRYLANRVLPSGPLRQKLSRSWTALLNRSTESVEIPIGGASIRVKPAFRHLSPDYEKETITSWLTVMKAGDHVWDVGVNLGVYTVLTGKAIGPSGRVVGWEASPGTARIAQEHVKLNGVEAWCSVHNKAVSNVDGCTLRIAVDSSELASPTNRISKQNGTSVESEGKEYHEVPSETLDGAWQRLGISPDWIKIDIEGAEYLALQGGSRIMSSENANRPTILMEVHPMFLPEFGVSGVDIVKILEERNYCVLTITGRAVTTVDYAEYWLVPKEKVEAFQLRLAP
jgi:FkbM family methyltransferase